MIQNWPARSAQADFGCEKLAFFDGADGALISTGAAGNADVGVDLVLAVAFSNSADGALVGAGAAGHASISNNVSHGITSKLDLTRYV